MSAVLKIHKVYFLFYAELIAAKLCVHVQRQMYIFCLPPPRLFFFCFFFFFGGGGILQCNLRCLFMSL